MKVLQAKDLMLKKAATSCLAPTDVKALQFTPYGEGHDLAIFPAALAGFKIPYFTLDGRVDESIYRFRLLQVRPSIEKGWAALKEDPVKQRRYTQPAGTNCGVYLPPSVSWKEVARNPSIEVIITEGELKAACACKLGFPTIGLGGVYNWRSSKEGYELLPILEKFDWNERKVYIAFDSDAKSNPMVRMAASRLAWTLGVRSALVHIITLPEGEEGKKQGLDDLIFSMARVSGRKTGKLSNLSGEALLQAVGSADFQPGVNFLGELVANSEDIGPGKELHRLNGEVGLVRKTNEIVEILTGNVYTPAAFSESVYKNRVYTETDDKNRMVRKFAAKEWLAIEHRTEFTEFAYDPSCNRVVTDSGAYNTWYAQKWATEPSKTFAGRPVSMEPWERLFNHVFQSLTEAERLWVRQWLAYPIQHPGTKLYTALLVWGRTTGTGKSRIGETMKTIYGKNYAVINNAHLTANFNEWAENKQFIVGDEISIGDKRGVANTLKGLITSDTIRLNIKNRKSFVIDDCINFYFSSNHEDAIYLENHDRRFFIVHAEIDRLPGTFYTDYMRWLEEEGGAARLFYYLKYEVNLAAQELNSPTGIVRVPAFNPKGEAPTTAAKLEMMATGRSDVEDWAVGLKHDPDKQLGEGERRGFDLYTTKELLWFYDKGEGKVRSNGMARALNAAGVFKCANGSNHVQVAGARDVVYAVRNVEKYRRLGPVAITKAYADERPPQFRVGSSNRFAPNKVQ